VTPDRYRRYRQDGDVDALFRVAERGVVFFDDMDMALRDRNTVGETEDQSVFLTALDGMRVKRGVVFVFTTNCTLDLIDAAFKRPGRIDVVLPFGKPDASMRRELVRRWHGDIRQNLDENTIVGSTDGFSFAEIEELKNLLAMRYIDRGVWDWTWALEQFDANRTDFEPRKTVLGFSSDRR
jgi:SpoVK/Ycf46/Vps4 family AAA+-type ATPase